MQNCEDSVPAIAIHLKANYQEPTKRFQSSAKPKTQSLGKKLFLPLEKTDTKLRTKLPCVCFGNVSVIGSQVK